MNKVPGKNLRVEICPGLLIDNVGRSWCTAQCSPLQPTTTSRSESIPPCIYISSLSQQSFAQKHPGLVFAASTLQISAKVLNKPHNRDMVVEFEVKYDSNYSNDITKCCSGLLVVISGPKNRFQRSRSVNETCVCTPWQLAFCY